MHSKIPKCPEELRWIVRVLSFYGKTNAEDITSKFPRDVLQSIAAQLKFSTISFPEKIVRIMIGLILQEFSTKWRLKATSLLKNLRNPNKKFHIYYPKDFHSNHLFSGLLKQSGFTWHGYQSAICITHDVDNVIGYDYLPHLTAINRKYGIVSTINLLTHDDYEVELTLLLKLLEENNEIGLHGYTHDIGIAYRNVNTIQRSLNSSIQTLGVPIAGFRGPALCNSPKLIKVIEVLGMRYDSSVQVLSPFYRSIGLNFPYPLLGSSLWELPIAIQDDYFFRDFNLSDAEALRILKQILIEIHELGGVAILGFHPHIMVDRNHFYHAALKLITTFNDTWVTTTGALFNYVSSEYHKCQKKSYAKTD